MNSPMYAVNGGDNGPSFEQINLLSIDLFKSTISSINNNKLLTEISETRGKHNFRGLDTSENNSVYTYYEDGYYPFDRPEAERLIDAIVGAASNILKKDMEMSEIWTVSLSMGQSVQAHSHKSNRAIHQNEYYSFTYYPSAPEGSAELCFYADACGSIESALRIKPNTSDFILFNSFLMHFTTRHMSETNRVVISGNLKPKFPNTMCNQDHAPVWRQVPKVPTINFRVVSPYGFEDYVIKLYADETASISTFGRESTPIANYKLEKKLFTTEFLIESPMDAMIKIKFLIDEQTKKISGTVKIGDYLELPAEGNYNEI